MRVVLDTCILKLATFPADRNASALIYELARTGLIEVWVSPAILEEYADVLGDHPEFVAEVVESLRVCYPSLRRLIVGGRFHPNALENARWGRRLGRVEGSLRRYASLTHRDGNLPDLESPR